MKYRQKVSLTTYVIIAALIAGGGLISQEGGIVTTSSAKTTQPFGTEKEQKIITTGGVGLRKRANFNSAPIMSIPKGKELKSIRYSKNWFKVEYNGKTGWISRKRAYVKGVVQPWTGTFFESKRKLYPKKQFGQLPIYKSETKSKSNIIGYLYPGQYFQTTGKASEYSKMYFGKSESGVEGWINSENLVQNSYSSTKKMTMPTDKERKGYPKNLIVIGENKVKASFSPRLTSQKRFSLSVGTKVKALAKKNNYILIETKAKSLGWVKSNYLVSAELRARMVDRKGSVIVTDVKEDTSKSSDSRIAYSALVLDTDNLQESTVSRKTIYVEKSNKRIISALRDESILMLDIEINDDDEFEIDGFSLLEQSDLIDIGDSLKFATTIGESVDIFEEITEELIVNDEVGAIDSEEELVVNDEGETMDSIESDIEETTIVKKGNKLNLNLKQGEKVLIVENFLPNKFVKVMLSDGTLGYIEKTNLLFDGISAIDADEYEEGSDGIDLKDRTEEVVNLMKQIAQYLSI